MVEIAKQFDLSYKTIANHCTQLKHKLGARSAMELVRIAPDAKL
jgi:two-component system, NarL family, invasion response regulator UvrY